MIRKIAEESLQIHRQTDPSGSVSWSRIDGSGGTKIYVCVRPVEGQGIHAQVREIYRKLGDFLRQQGSAREAVISERIFFSDLTSQVESMLEIRADFYGESSPATTYLEQPPCQAGVLCELQARVIFSQNPGAMTVRSLEGLAEPATAKVVSYLGYDHLYLHNLTGGLLGDNLSFEEQMVAVFDEAENLLAKEGMTFRDVIRTWIFLSDMERDYDALNRVRSRFFDRANIQMIPASTGIAAKVYPCDRGGSIDLYALRSDRPVEIRLMHAGTLNEAWSYGSNFSRGIVATREDRSVIYLSGTASIDIEGEVVHKGDIEGQVHRMLINIEQLLKGSGAKPADIVRATTYLKHAEHADVFRRVYAEHGFPRDIPLTVCHAAICRPDWLVETELAAIFAH